MLSRRVYKCEQVAFLQRFLEDFVGARATIAGDGAPDILIGTIADF
jgi:hypothetical protein